MREQQIEEKLRNLPRYSLSMEQKRHIVQKLQEKGRIRRQRFRPGLSVLFASAVIIVLALTQLPLNSQRDTSITESEESKEMLATDTVKETAIEAVEGKPFMLSDTNQEAIGIEGKIGILNTFDHFVAEDKRRVAKLMLFFWDDQAELLGKQVEVKATNGQQELILTKAEIGGSLYGEDGHILTKFQPFPKEGTWKLSFFIEEELFAAFTLEVLPPLPATEHFTLVESPKEIKMGNKRNMTIEGTGENKENINIQLLDDSGKIAEEAVFVQNGEAIDAETNEPIYFYEGKLEFSKKGTWVLQINGEKTKPFTN